MSTRAVDTAVANAAVRSLRRFLVGFASAAVALAFSASARAASVHVLDAMRDPAAWTAVASDQVEAKLRRADDGLCLDFDFHGVSGYAAIRRTLAVDYPANYEFTFRVRGDAPANALQFKVADASGDNVWWVNRPDFAFPHAWSEQRYKKRQIDFAWGPLEDHTLRHSENLEFTLYAGSGGKGSACFDALALREQPPTPATWPAPIARASSALEDAPAANAVDGRLDGAWRSDPKSGAEQTLTLDLGGEREFGGLVLRWDDTAFASDYDIEFSDDGDEWQRVRRVVGGNGGLDPLYLPESSARYVRLDLHKGPAAGYALREIEIRDLAFGASANAFFSELAKQEPRGAYPRGFYDEQTYWTVVGTDGGHETGLFSEDGALEVARGGFSIEPFLIDEQGRLTSWADAAITHALVDRYLPMPSATWTRDDLRLTASAFARGDAKASHLLARYELENLSDHERSITLALALRPFQVNPSVQFLNTPGGVSPIHTLAWDDTAVVVDGKARVFPLDSPSTFRAATFDAGMIVAKLGSMFMPTRFRDSNGAREHRRKLAAIAPESIDDPTGLASGALLYGVSLAPHERRSVALAIPLDGDTGNPLAAPIERNGGFERERTAAAADWHRRLDTVGLRLPPAAQPLADTLRTALAHILISRDGPALRPGTRAYARSWVRDGAMMVEALLRLGRDDVPRDYLDWYAPYQFKNGKVPCCVDQRGSDPVPENDSHGELIHLASEVYRYTGDRRVLERAWPHVDAAARYMDGLRASERSEANQSGERKAFYGLMPASISHEGYSAKPMHSYWDDFWALLGYKDATAIAEALGRKDDAARLAAARDEFRDDLYASLRLAMGTHAIDYLPGCAELGDFDATSTTIALSPAGEQSALPQAALRNTFERYWKNFDERRTSNTWKDYTPYEWRTVGTFVRLGWRERAQAAIDFFMGDRRPREWNQWAEVVGRNARESRFIGDMPHGWVASDFIRSALDLFAYERDADHAIVLAAGVPPAWLAGDGIAIDGLRTRYGSLSYTLREDGKALRLHVSSDAKAPPLGGYVLPWPLKQKPGDVRINASNVRLVGDAIRFARVPADVVVTISAEK